MSTGFNREFTAQRHRLLGDDELIQIAYTKSENYLPEAVAIAREELARRGFAHVPEAALVERGQQFEAEQRAIKDIPLAMGWKLVMAVGPWLICLIAYFVLSTTGRRRAASDAGWWIVYGVMVKTVLIAILVVVYWHG